MKRWCEWQVVRRQVAICGRLVDGHDKPVAGGIVTLTAMPARFERRVAGLAGAVGNRWPELDLRPDRVTSRGDGVYFFLDLPAGRYTLSAAHPRSDASGEKTVSVAWSDEGTVKRVTADFVLS